MAPHRNGTETGHRRTKSGKKPPPSGCVCPFRHSETRRPSRWSVCCPCRTATAHPLKPAPPRSKWYLCCIHCPVGHADLGRVKIAPGERGGPSSPFSRAIFFGIVHFKHTHFRYPETRFLAHGVQRYGREGAWPLTPRTPIPEIRLTSCYPHQCHPALECPGKRSRDIYCAPECAIAYSQYCASNLLCKENTACPFHGSSSSLAFYAL